MLKSKRGISACSLSSCRIRAEALARAFNSRIWPCVWIPQRLSGERDRRMSNGIEDEEEFFDASPSPVEVEDESLFCQHHSSAATEAGRAKLYELLQQHAADDAIDVFYDVSEDAGLTDTATCLRNKETDEVEKYCETSKSCGLLDDERKFSNKLNINGCDKKEGDLMFPIADQSRNSVQSEISDGHESQLSNGQKQQSVLDSSTYCCSNCEGCDDDPANTEENDHSFHNYLNEDNNFKDNELVDPQVEAKFLIEAHSDTEEPLINEVNIANENESVDTESKDKYFIEEHSDTEKPLTNEGNILKENESVDADENDKCLFEEHSDTETALINEDKIPEDTTQNVVSSEETKNADLPSENANGDMTVADEKEDSSNSVQDNFECVLDSTDGKTILKEDDENNVAIEVTSEIDSPSADKSDSKVSSPTSRLQVFDESRPKISRSTSLKTGKTPPGTPSRKKIVRFADVLGLDLEDIHHIMTGDVPIIPSSAYTDLNLKGIDLPTCEPIAETVEISRRDSANWNSMPGSTATNVLYPMFAIPGQQPDFMDRVRNQGICLETVTVSEMSVQCTCKVMNYGYYKKVIARYTVNDWRSSNDIDASYISGSSNGETDSFAFSIFLSPQNKNVKFALKYDVNGNEYWDNNRNQDYCFGYHGNFHMQHLPSPLWQHQFW